MKKVSVIVPVYNTESYLEECLNSLVNQTLQDIEIVIIDDGSTDSSPEIIAEYKNKYPEKIVSIQKENGGQGTARNLAFQYCTGAYVGFLDSDDYAKLDMFEKLYHLAKEKDYDCVSCGLTRFYDDGEKRVIITPYMASPQCHSQREMFKSILTCSCLHLFKREVIIDNGITFTEGVVYEDTAFFAKAIPYIRSVGYLAESLMYRRMRRESSLHHVTAQRVSNIFTVIDDVNVWFAEKKLNQYMLEKEYFSLRILMCSSLERISKVKSFQERKVLIDKTLMYIQREYPEYKKNPYLIESKKGYYIKYTNRYLMMLLCFVYMVKRMIKKEYI